MVWAFFITHCALLIGLFVWLDSRQAARYNLFEQWTQIFSKMLGEDMQQIRSDVTDINLGREELQTLIKFDVVHAIQEAARR